MKKEVHVSQKAMRYFLSFLFGLLMVNATSASDLVNTNSTLATHSNLQQQKVIKGTVIDEDGMPLPGVNIIVKGTTRGVQTNFNGKYTIKASKGEILQFSYVGMKTANVKVKSSDVINVTLKVDASTLEEVVVIGYGTKSKASLSGAVDVVSSDVLESKPISNTLSAVQGVLPGVTITRGSGQPGGENFNINIRGMSSINGGNEPLILVDGNPVDDLNLLNPHDIKSMSVLKDASAAIYGSRAAGGVILITTKTGKKGRPVVKFSANTAFSKPLNKIEYPNLWEYAHMHREAEQNNGVANIFWNDERLQKIKKHAAPERFGTNPEFQFYKGTDWFDELYGNGMQQDYNVSISGGGDYSDYYFSLGYNKNDGLLKNAPDKADRYNLRMNYNYDISDNLRIEAKLNFDRLEVNEVHNLGRVLGGISTTPIFFPVRTQGGKNWFSQWGYMNPVAVATQSEPREKWTNRISPNIKIDWKLLEQLKLTAQAGISFENYDSKLVKKKMPYYFWDNKLAYYEYQTNPNNANYAFSKSQQRNYALNLNYNDTFNEDHAVSAMIGVTHDEYNYDWFSAYRDDFVSNDLFSLNLGATKNMSNNGGGEQWTLESVVSRLGYVYKDRYIAEANFRYDGSSKFVKDKRWVLFKGFSLAWRLSEEEFIKNLNFFDNLKIRASYGEVGNQTGIGLYDYIQNIRISGKYPFGNTQKAQSAKLDGMVSTERTWETLTSQNIGIDASIFKSRLNVGFDYYIKNNKNMLLSVTLPQVLGAAPPKANNGELKTWGWELSLDWKDKVSDFNYGARFVIGNNDNKVINLGGLDSYQKGFNRFREGYRTNLYYGYVFDGIIKTQKQLDEYKKLKGVPNNIGIGDAMYKDVDGNGRIDAYSDERKNGDLKILGTTDPQYSFSLNLNAEYKGIDFSTFFQGVGKRTVFREGTARIPFAQPWYHPARLYYNQTWSKDRPNAKYPRISHGNIRWWNFDHSSNNEENAAYIRLKNIQIGYTLPKSLMTHIKYVSKMRIYFSGTDLWDYHNMGGGFDPEDNSYGTNYPFAKTISLGIDVTF